MLGGVEIQRSRSHLYLGLLIDDLVTEPGGEKNTGAMASTTGPTPHFSGAQPAGYSTRWLTNAL